MGRRFSAFEEFRGTIGGILQLASLLASYVIVYYFLVDVLDIHPDVSFFLAFFFGPVSFHFILETFFKRKTEEEKTFFQKIKEAFDSVGWLVAKVVLSLGAAAVLFRATLFVLGSDWVMVALCIAITGSSIVWIGTETILFGGKQTNLIETEHEGVVYERIRGGRLLMAWEVQSRTNKIKANRIGYIACGAFVIPQEEAPLGFAYVGSPGSGKTMSIRLHMQSTLPHIGRGLDHRAVIYDAKGDMPQILAGMGIPNRLVKNFNSYDFRSVRLALWKDIRDGKSINELASAIVTEGRGNDPIWEKLAKGLLECVFR